MRTRMRRSVFAVAICAACLPAGAQTVDQLVADLGAGTVDSVRINLNPWGANLGFEVILGSDDSGVQRLIHLIRNAEPGTGHKCANVGAVRFMMSDGRRIALGLLPSHDHPGFELRLDNDGVYVGVLRVDQEPLLPTLEDLGVPRDDPWLSP